MPHVALSSCWTQSFDPGERPHVRIHGSISVQGSRHTLTELCQASTLKGRKLPLGHFQQRLLLDHGPLSHDHFLVFNQKLLLFQGRCLLLRLKTVV